MIIVQKKPIKVGCSHYFTIPRALIKAGIIDPKKRYDVEINLTKND